MTTDKTVKTTCPYCGVGCGVLATPKADGSVEIKGDPDHPANFGRLCSKGSALGETLSLDDRLLFPEINGERADWDSALDLVAEKFSASINEHGPDSVALYVSGQILTEDYYVANKLMKGYIGSANIDTNSRLCMASSVAGHRKAFGTDTVPGCYEDLEEADLIVLVGSNLAWCHPVIYQRIAAAKEQRPGMKVVLVDPRRTMTADLADMHLAIDPDGDVALFNGLLTHISKAGKLDSAYIEEHTNGFEEALTTAASLSDEDLAKQTGLSHNELQNFYELFAETEKVVTVYSQGVNQSSCGTDKVNAIINCHLATGRIGKVGMGPFSITGQPNAMGGREVGGLANMLAAHMNIEDKKHRETVQTFWNSPTISTKQGLKAVDMYEAVADGRIKALWIMSTNPVDSMPEANAVQSAIENCPFVVVSEVVEATDTLRHAHVKLPSAAWGEKDGTVTNSERRISRQRSFLSLPGEAMPDWRQLAEVAKRMGFADGFNWKDNAAVFRESAALSAYKNEDTRDFDIGALTDVETKTYDELKPFQWPLRAGESNQNTTRFFANGEFYTPNRKAKFIATKAAAHQCRNEAHPYTLNTGRIRDQWHTMTRTAKTARLSTHIAEPFCEIHPTDAATLDVKDAELLQLENDHGEIIVRALITDRVKQGSVFVPLHWTDQYASNGRVDILVPAKTDPFSGQPASKNVAIAINKYAAKQYGYLVCKDEPQLNTDYWAKARLKGGWQAEIASLETIEDPAILIAGLNIEATPLSYYDQQNGETRLAWFEGETLVAALYLSSQPVAVARSLVADWLSTPHETSADQLCVLAGRPGADMPDKGAIVCSCFAIGSNEIAAAATDGCNTVSLIGNCTKAGTNCGSCRSEIAAIISQYKLEAAE